MENLLKKESSNIKLSKNAAKKTKKKNLNNNQARVGERFSESGGSVRKLHRSFNED